MAFLLGGNLHSTTCSSALFLNSVSKSRSCAFGHKSERLNSLGSFQTSCIFGDNVGFNVFLKKTLSYKKEVHNNSITSMYSEEIFRKKHNPTCNAQPSTATSVLTIEDFIDEQEYVKSGGELIDLVKMQSNKVLNQTKIIDMLKPLSDVAKFDLIVIGCGPAGLSIAAESANLGLVVGLIGPDLPFVNNYGVWLDEFKAIGLDHCIEQKWKDTAVYIESDLPVLIGREYGRVGRDLLHNELVERCASAGVYYLNSQVISISQNESDGSFVYCEDGSVAKCRLVAVAAGAASGKFLNYEKATKGVGIQTAYGIEVEVESYPYDINIMHFMDYRDFSDDMTSDFNGDEFSNVPSFLYAMPMSPTRVFFEETCLAARPAMSFEELKKRLSKRLDFLGLKITSLHEEEWSYIPVGGSLPLSNQNHIGFGAAASMIHPATGYSITRSLSEAPQFALEISKALNQNFSSTLLANQNVTNLIAAQAWDSLWSMERKRQRAFMIFGLELILQLDLQTIRDFFQTFFKLPEWLWRGFLASNLSSTDLILFALCTFAIAPNSLRLKLVKHLFTDPSGEHLVKVYAGFQAKAI